MARKLHHFREKEPYRTRHVSRTTRVRWRPSTWSPHRSEWPSGSGHPHPRLGRRGTPDGQVRGPCSQSQSRQSNCSKAVERYVQTAPLRKAHLVLGQALMTTGTPTRPSPIQIRSQEPRDGSWPDPTGCRCTARPIASHPANGQGGRDVSYCVHLAH